MDYLKSDSSLVRNSTTNKINESMCKVIIDVGHAMGFMTVGKFIEEEVIYKRRVGVGIDSMQGYFIDQSNEV